MTESQIQKQIMAYLKAAGIYHWRNNTGRRGGVSYGLAGSPDIMGMTKSGRFLGIEVKDATGTQKPAQIEFQQNCEATGGLYILARSLDDVIACRAELFDSA